MPGGSPVHWCEPVTRRGGARAGALSRADDRSRREHGYARPTTRKDQKETMTRALITGITGQDGLYLAELLLSKGYEVFGLIRGRNNPKFELVPSTIPDVTLLTGDLTDVSSLVRVLGAAQPEEVYNLGAIS